MKRRPKAWTWSIVASLATHAGLVAALLMTFGDRREPTESAKSPSNPAAAKAAHPVAPAEPPGAADKQAEPGKDKVGDVITESDRRVANMTPDEKMAELKKKRSLLDRVSDAGVKRIAGLAERFHGVDNERAYEPHPGATGQFDTASAVLYDITREDNDGQVIYIQTLVDRDGRTVKARTPAKSMSDADLRSYRVFEMSRSNPKLRRLIRSAVRIGHARVSRGE